MKAKFETKIIN